MLEDDRAWMRAIEQTYVVRFPKQHLATFGSTNVSYYVVTEPVYQEIDAQKREGVVRTGRVKAAKPAVVTPTYAMSLEGFSSEAYDYLRHVAQETGANSPGVLYQYKNEPENMEIVGGVPGDIAHKISNDLNERNEDMSVVMVGVDELWDVALLKFIYEFTSSSAAGNIQDFQTSGLLEPQHHVGGVPRAAVQHINRLFAEVERGANPDLLKQELDRWGLFQFYEDRFLNLFRGTTL